MIELLCTTLLCFVGIVSTFTTASVIINSPRKVFSSGTGTVVAGRTHLETNHTFSSRKYNAYNMENNTMEIQLACNTTILLDNLNRTEDATELRNKPLSDSSSGVAGTIVNIPVLGKPELQVQPPDVIEIVTAGKPTVQFIEQPSIQLQLVPVPHEIPVASKPEIVISTGPSQLFQIPLLPNISIANPFISLFGNNLTLFKPPQTNVFSVLTGGVGKPSKPLYAKIVNAINRIQRKLLQLTGLGTVMPNSTTIQAYKDNVLTVIKVLMMDTPF